MSERDWHKWKTVGWVYQWKHVGWKTELESWSLLSPGYYRVAIIIIFGVGQHSHLPVVGPGNSG